MALNIADSVKQKCQSHFQSVHYVECIDHSDGLSCDGGAKLELILVSDQFDQIHLLQRHRMVNECISDLMPKIHAITMKTWTRSQYEAKVPKKE